MDKDRRRLKTFDGFNNKELMKLNINKSNWLKVKLVDVVEWYQRDIPNDLQIANGIEYYVTANDIDSDAITFNRRGMLEDGQKGPTITKHFEKGDFLLSTRSVALRKAALAPIAGVTGEKLLVLRVKENSDLIKELLPFVMHSDTFWEFAQNSASGSVNKFTSWTKLREYEFLLPPKDQQKQLAELLWAMDNVIEKEREVLVKLRKSKSSLFKESLYSACETTDKYFGNLTSNFKVEKVGKYFKELQYGISEELTEIGEVPVLRMNNLQGGKLDFEDLKYFSPKNGELDKFILNEGDILFNRTNSFDLVGKVSRFSAKGKYSFASYLIRIKTDESKLDSRFLNFYFNSSIGLAKIRKYRTPGVSQSNINAQNVKNVPIPLPHVNFQKELMDKIEKFETSELNIESKITSSKALQKSLINQIF